PPLSAAPIHSHSFFCLCRATSPSVIYTLSLHDALPIYMVGVPGPPAKGAAIGVDVETAARHHFVLRMAFKMPCYRPQRPRHQHRSEEHTSELQSRENLVCRLLLEKKKKNNTAHYNASTS